MTSVVNRFLRYTKIDTESDFTSDSCPSTRKQFDLAKVLMKELEEMGLSKVTLDNHGYLMATLPSNMEQEVPTIGFIAHMDTSPDFTGANVKPQIVENYDGNDIVLNEKENIILSPKDFPELKNYVGQKLITTDGTTLLGADNKAGIAEIVTAIQYLVNNPEIKHGKIKIGFTPDEEIGRGADLFDVEKFGADFAYTIDGGQIGELEYENFNAAGATVNIQGRSVHPGEAKNKMINGLQVAMEFNAMLPEKEKPEHTEKYEGFFHLMNISGGVDKASMMYIIRDHDNKIYQERKELIAENAKKINDRYGKEVVTVEIKDQYFNMKEKIEPVMHIIETAEKAMIEVGVKPIKKPIRGGTDGARLSFMGLPCPNIFTGGHNFHGRYEYIPTKSMEKSVDVILKIVELYSQK